MGKELSKRRKIIRIVALCLAGVLLLGILIVGGYVIYVAAQYYRVGDIDLVAENERETKVEQGKDYSILTYNLGFGAYSPEYSFFMDTGIMKEGNKKVTGKYAKGMSKADVNKNVNGQLMLAQSVGADFYFFQEVDEDGDRSYHINMKKLLTGGLPEYAFTYAENFHTANLLYPFNDPIGKSNSGLLTFSKYKVESAARRSFPVTTAFIDKLFDLDRCFSMHYLPVEGSAKKLVLINLHMSAYDEGGKIRAKQLALLNEVFAQEAEAGNYVIAGGDFNHCLIADHFSSNEEAFTYFESAQLTPDWVKNSVLRNENIEVEGYSIAAPMNEGTCRGADIPYKKGVNFCTVIDGFIISPNVELSFVKTLTDEYGYSPYAYSDHNPVLMNFQLN